MEDDKRPATKRDPKLTYVQANEIGGSPAKLIQLTPKVDATTIQTLESLLQEARAGELTGIAFAAMYRSRRYTISTTGQVHNNPTFALGMLQVLSQRIADGID